MATTSAFIFNNWVSAHPVIFALALAWSLVWKGLGLYRAAELRQKKWFIALLILNTFGILEIIYLYAIARKYKVEVVEN